MASRSFQTKRCPWPHALRNEQEQVLEGTWSSRTVLRQDLWHCDWIRLTWRLLSRARQQSMLPFTNRVLGLSPPLSASDWEALQPVRKILSQKCFIALEKTLLNSKTGRSAPASRTVNGMTGKRGLHWLPKIVVFRNATHTDSSPKLFACWTKALIDKLDWSKAFCTERNFGKVVFKCSFFWDLLKLRKLSNWRKSGCAERKNTEWGGRWPEASAHLLTWSGTGLPEQESAVFANTKNCFKVQSWHATASNIARPATPSWNTENMGKPRSWTEWEKRSTVLECCCAPHHARESGPSQHYTWSSVLSFWVAHEFRRDETCKRRPPQPALRCPDVRDRALRSDMKQSLLQEMVSWGSLLSSMPSKSRQWLQHLEKSYTGWVRKTSMLSRSTKSKCFNQSKT